MALQCAGALSSAGTLAACRGLKVKAAQEAGAVGLILYNVPQEDGQFSSEDEYAVFPEGPARHLSAIQRGSVSFFNVGAGPYPEPAFTPSILSISISFCDARHLFDTLEGHGLGRSDPPPGWQGLFPGLEYYSGPSHMMLELVNDIEYIDTELYNVVGTIKGESSECVVRWLRGPSVWIHSNEREYGLLNPTAWATRNFNYSKKNCIAYINVDESTSGGDTQGPVGSPLLAETLYEAAKLVPSPLNEEVEVEDGWFLFNTDTEVPYSIAPSTPISSTTQKPVSHPWTHP
ncbi:hypothetical protein BJX68DRAFT_261138 [Aspergillus pseudodeflectus]|uniref:PA domain-containing protein n=1 Tax=Aspergillus pseudodeflectus TaxID=176178 RepID=A0ABR4L707_9EURO